MLAEPGGTARALLDEIGTWLAHWAPATAATVAGVSTVGVVLRLLCRLVQHRRMTTGARVVSVLPPPSVELSGAITLWSNMVGLLRPWWWRYLGGQPHLAFEYRFNHDGVSISMWVPGVVPPGMIERAIEAAWPGVRTTTEPATRPSPCQPQAGQRMHTVGGYVRLARHEALPIRTDFSSDPLRPLLGALVGLGRHEHAVVQVLARPATGHRTATARRAARHIRAGRSCNAFVRLIDSVTATPPAPRPTPTRTTPTWDPQGVLEYAAQDRAIVAKQRNNPFDTAIRYAVSTMTPDTATRSQRRHVLQTLRGRAHAIAAATAGFSDYNFYRRRRLLRPSATLAHRRLWRGDLLSVPELSALAHLPVDQATPGLQRAGARAVAPPAGIASPGPDVIPIGISDAGQPRPVGLRVADARHHIHILGPTGSGKSELMARMVLDDAEAGRGIVVVDPKGDLVEDILMRLPAQIGDRVVLLDSDSPTRPPVLNPLEGDDIASTVDNLVSIFSRVYSSSWGPRTDDLLRSGLLTLRTLPGSPTLMDLPKLLTISSFRQRAMEQINDEILTGFWKWYDDLSDATRAQVAAPLMNKLRGLLLRPFVRATLAGGESTINMDNVLDGGICLVRLAKGTLSTDTVHLLGSIVVASTWQAATRRSRVPPHARRDCGLVIDEFQNFMNLPYPVDDMLAESRAYKMRLTLGHHFLLKLQRELEEGISTNARNKIFFSVSPEDARRAARHFAPHLSEHDLAHLGRFHVAARLVLDSENAPAFTAVTEKLLPPVPGRAQHIRRLAALNAQPPSAHDSSSAEPEQTMHDPRRTA
ncbi:type IV secretion system DNA-binding domain-containing protein [Kibdelosporangium philippinense]|uniref:Type IV secretion system DNA-binding domain-containing protein n=2 Tax=Kibdelosporangium philippinense TaxID=211113 RepID=A0ABS8ZIY3_9PSEU|nr:type IV secretion system DNA-binding domain-containing protein [Kibdelosporangium philippinense]